MAYNLVLLFFVVLANASFRKLIFAAVRHAPVESNDVVNNIDDNDDDSDDAKLGARVLRDLRRVVRHDEPHWRPTRFAWTSVCVL